MLLCKRSLLIALAFFSLTTLIFERQASANCIEFVYLGGPLSPNVGDDVQIGFRFAHQSTDIRAINLSLVATGDLEFTTISQRGDIYDESAPFSTYLNSGGAAAIGPSNLASDFDWLGLAPGEGAPVDSLETFNDAQGFNGDAINGFTDPGILGIVNVHIIGTAGGTINFAGTLLDGSFADVTSVSSFGHITFDFGNSFELHPPDCAVVPEPSMALLMGLGLVLLGGKGGKGSRIGDHAVAGVPFVAFVGSRSATWSKRAS